MSDMPHQQRSMMVKDQVSGIAVDLINTARREAENLRQVTQDAAFGKAVAQIEHVRAFVGAPDRILGSELTKHGEIAEQVEVGVRNARSLLYGQEMNASFDGVGRTAAEDYLIDGVAVQSKFINGVSNNLDAVLDHMGKYDYFGRDGSYYHIPKDTHETISQLMRGESGALSERTASTILDKVRQIEQQTGRRFEEVVRPGVSNYGEVQQGVVHRTLDGHEEQLTQANTRIKEEIAQDHGPSLAEAAQAATVAAAVGGALTFTTSLYAKYKSGKNPFKGDFTPEDWKEVGLDAGKGAAGGAITGGAIYLMTNYADMAAPYAAAVVSAAKGVGALVMQLDAGEIDFDQFIDLGMVVCAESAIVGLATMAGQTLIPIPVVGAVIGSLAGRLVAEFATGKTEEVARRVREDMERFVQALDGKLRAVIQSIDAEFDRLGALTEAAFDIERNKSLLRSSVQLATAYGVSKSQLIDSHQDLDDFMLA
jgi:hypothetical protein